MSPHLLEFFTVGLGLLLLLGEAFAPPRDKRVLAWAGAAGLGVIFLLLPFTDPAALPAESIAPFYAADPLALFFKGFSLLATIIVLLIAAGMHRSLGTGINGPQGGSGGLAEFYCLPVFACAGLMWTVSARDLIFLFVALELVTVSFYVMVAAMRRNVGSLEAGVKYLVLGALSTGLLVYGLTWIIGATGLTSLPALAEHLSGSDQNLGAILFGVLLVLAALSFKVGVAPFHVWIPDVYQGAPTATTAYLSVASKAAGVVVLMRFLNPFLDNSLLAGRILPLLGILAALTLLAGNLGAIPQRNFKRLLAYSSIGHAGFIMLGVLARDWAGVSFYLAAYLLMTLAAFQVLAVVRAGGGSDDLAAFDGLGRRAPWAAFALLVGMASLAGVPLTAGFLGKFRMFIDAVGMKQWPLVACAMVGAAAGFYYYFKVVKHMYWHAPADPRPLPLPIAPRAVLGLLTAATLVLGVYPKPVARLLAPANPPQAELEPPGE
jgi:NADH-quinone oxidoreductase subunit N